MLIIEAKETKDDAMVVDEPSSSRPTRQRKASTKRFDDPEMLKSVESSGILATKAGIVNGSASKAKGKSKPGKSKGRVGPGRSAVGVDPTLLQNADDALEVADEIGVAGDDVTVNIADTAPAVTTPPTPPSREKITEELKELAKGVIGGDEELAEYEEAPNGKDLSIVTEVDVAMPQAGECVWRIAHHV